MIEEFSKSGNLFFELSIKSKTRRYGQFWSMPKESNIYTRLTKCSRTIVLYTSKCVHLEVEMWKNDITLCNTQIEDVSGVRHS